MPKRFRLEPAIWKMLFVYSLYPLYGLQVSCVAWRCGALAVSSQAVSWLAVLGHDKPGMSGHVGLDWAGHSYYGNTNQPILPIEQAKGTIIY